MNVCKFCESYIAYKKCDSKDVCELKKIETENLKLKEENKRLKSQIIDLRLNMSYMINPNAIGNRHEMGG